MLATCTPRKKTWFFFNEEIQRNYDNLSGHQDALKEMVCCAILVGSLFMGPAVLLHQKGSARINVFSVYSITHCSSSGTVMYIVKGCKQAKNPFWYLKMPKSLNNNIMQVHNIQVSQDLAKIDYYAKSMYPCPRLGHGI